MKLLKTKELAEFTKMVGANLRYIRIARKLSQTKVSHALDVTFQQMQKYEAGTNCINAWRLVQLSNFFKVPVSDILNVDYIANSCNKKTPQVEDNLQPQVMVGSLKEITDKLKKDGIDPEETILPKLRKAAKEKVKYDVERRMVFDPNKYDEFEDEYPAPLTQLEHDPKMRATYDAILDARKRRH